MSNAESLTGNDTNAQVSLNALDFVPKYVKDLMVLDAMGIKEEDTKVDILRIGEDGKVERVPARRIPLLGIVYRDMNAAHDAVLSAMGY